MKQASTPWEPLEALAEEQREKLEAYRQLLLHFNRKINLISREDEPHVGRHIRHVLTLTWKGFPPGSAVVDWGTGGGLPAIPLAVCLPEIEVHAVDAASKKVQSVRAMARRLGLGNLHAWQGRAGDWPGQAQYSASRATVPLATLWRWHARIYEAPKRAPGEANWLPGLLCLKGGDLREEIAELERVFPEAGVERHALEPLLEEPFFADKYLVGVHWACRSRVGLNR